jgi:hypothetical protein
LLLSLHGQQLGSQQGVVRIDADDIGGVVTSAKGPEAGVWVIAETTDLPTRFARMVVTDDQGRYVVPDLPKASYNVWVRGYGLVDSPKVKPARQVPTLRRWRAETAAAQSPAIYCIRCQNSRGEASSARGKFPPRSPGEWLNSMKNGCRLPQMGTIHAYVPARGPHPR